MKIFGRCRKPNIIFNICVCGDMRDTFSERIMLWKPARTYTYTFEVKNINKSKLSKEIKRIKRKKAIRKVLRGDEYNYCSLDTIYIMYKDQLIGLNQDKKIIDLIKELEIEQIILYYIISLGASLHHFGYRFQVHSNEDVHKNSPHVHVKKDDVSVRYSLETFERYSQDNAPRQFIKDEKKIIVPFINEHIDEFREMWYLNVNGYRTAEVTSKSTLMYPES